MSLKLRHSPASPFVRKVRVFAHEVGLSDRIELMPTDVWALDSDIHHDNPLGKVPALVTGEGTFIGSALCCEYLDTLHHGRRLIPATAPERWAALYLHALADGIMESAVAHVVERLRRPKEMVFQGNLDRQETKMRHALDRIETRATALKDRVDIGTITLGCALAYLDFRLPQLTWRDHRPAMTLWYAGFAERPSMTTTRPAL